MPDLAQSDFDFYLKFTKPLVLALPSPQDKALAASWIKKLINTSSASLELKTKYVKALLLGLQRKRLNGVFGQHPNCIDITEENLALPFDKKKPISQSTGQFPWYTYDFSADLLQYVAIQEIKDFGVHGFFATSNSPIGTWHNVDHLLLPQPVKEFTSNLMENDGVPTFAAKPSKERIELKKKKQKFAKSIIKAVQAPPSSPIGNVSLADEDPEDNKTWKRPTWGSNLIQVDEIGSSYRQPPD